MSLRPGDRLADESGEWEVLGRPYSTGGGKTAMSGCSGWVGMSLRWFGPGGSCPEACGKSERVFRSRRSHFCVTRMVSGQLL